jgi:hypothetical protein
MATEYEFEKGGGHSTDPDGLYQVVKIAPLEGGGGAFVITDASGVVYQSDLPNLERIQTLQSLLDVMGGKGWKLYSP